MRTQTINVSARSRAAPSEVWRLLAAGATWPRWSGHTGFELERPDEAGAEGVGAVRAFTAGRVRSRERIVEVAANQRLSYVLVSGMPLRDYRADVDLIPLDDGTAISWQATFRPKFAGTGWIYRLALRRFLVRAAEGLADEAATHGSQRS